MAKGLGRGLSALFSDTEEAYENARTETGENALAGATEVEVSEIFPNPHQPRKAFDENALNDLANSIREHGIISPLVVNKNPDGTYMIIAGERRYRAAMKAGLTKVPVIVKELGDKEIQEISLIENLQREDLNPIEAAYGMKRLMEEFGLTQEMLAERLGKSRPAIANTLRLLTLAEEVVALVREMERAVKQYLNPPEVLAKEKEQKNALANAELKHLVERLRSTLKTKVSLIGTDKKGRIYIDYYTRDDLDRISELLDIIDRME